MMTMVPSFRVFLSSFFYGQTTDQMAIRVNIRFRGIHLTIKFLSFFSDDL